MQLMHHMIMSFNVFVQIILHSLFHQQSPFLRMARHVIHAVLIRKCEQDKDAFTVWFRAPLFP